MRLRSPNASPDAKCCTINDAKCCFVAFDAKCYTTVLS